MRVSVVMLRALRVIRANNGLSQVDASTRSISVRTLGALCRRGLIVWDGGDGEQVARLSGDGCGVLRRRPAPLTRTDENVCICRKGHDDGLSG